MKKIILIISFLVGINIYAQTEVQKKLHSVVNTGNFLIMAHKMAPAPENAENSIVSLKKGLRKDSKMIQEIDVRMSKDGVPVLIHDETIGRTMTGTGMVNAYTYKELKKFSLKNLKGQVIKEKIPTLLSALKLIKKHNGIVMLDMKPGTDPDRMMQDVIKTKMEERSIVICYTLEQGIEFHKKYPKMMLALGFPNKEEIDKIYQSPIPTTHLVALTPQGIHPPEFYRYILDKNIPISISAQGKIDNSENPKQGYKETIKLGGTILTTDYPDAVKSAFERE